MVIKKLAFISCLTLLFSKQCIAQSNQSLQNELNSIDTPNAWAQAPTNQIMYPPPVAPTAVPPAIYQAPYPNPYAANPFAVNQAANQLYAKQQMLRMLFGGSGNSNSGSNSNNNQNKFSSSTAYSDYQQAENQAAKAHDAEERARYDKDKGNRESDASEAYYAANAARDASDRVYYASQDGDPTAQQYAAKARAAADRARADSDQARYYADNGIN